MGGCCSSKYDEEYSSIDGYGFPSKNSVPDAKVGIAMMMQQAGTLMGGVASHHYDDNEGLMDEDVIERRVRLAKMQGSTLTVRDNCLYVDYQFVCQLPPGVTVNTN